MTRIYNIYCDESGHLEKDQIPIMVLGAIWCPLEKTKEIAIRLREIKQKHGLAKYFEIKWKKVSPGKLEMYLEILDYFFDDDDLHFRSLVVRDKSKLDHESYDQTHDDWYYKMYFQLLKILINPDSKYRVYLDIKDTKSAQKIMKLEEVLRNANYDFSRQIIDRIQTVRSHEIEQIQIADLLIGAVAYANRELATSPAKLEIINRIRERSGYPLTNNTLPGEKKFNVFIWHPSEVE